jgi:hypothetical protein
LQDNRLAIALEEFTPLGHVPVGRVHGIPSVSGEDRSITFLRACLDQLRPTLDHLSRHVDPGRRGVCAATSKGSLLAFLDADPDERRRDFTRWLANDPALVLAREADIRGPSQAFVGACATGLANISRAVEYIEAGWCDLALGGSTEATLHPTYLASFQNLGALASTGCYPFDARHEGFVAAEGAALFLFARRDIAQAAGRRAWPGTPPPPTPFMPWRSTPPAPPSSASPALPWPGPGGNPPMWIGSVPTGPPRRPTTGRRRPR